MDVSSKALTLLSIPILTRVFAPKAFGIIALLTMIAALLIPLMQMGMDSGAQLYFYRERDLEKRNRMNFSGLIFILAWGAVLAGVLLFLDNKIAQTLFEEDSYSGLVKLVIVVSYLGALINYGKYLLRLGMEKWRFIATTVTHNVLALGAGLYLILRHKWGLPGIYWGQVFGSFVPILLLICWSRHYYCPKFSANAVRSFLKVGIPVVPTAFFYLMATYIDRICLAKLSTLDEIGLYSIAVMLSGMVTMLAGMFQMAWGPIGLKLYYENEDYQRTYRCVMSSILALFCFVALLITAVRHELLALFTTSEYFGAHIVVGPLCVAGAIQGCYAVALIGISVSMRTYWMFVFAALALTINIVLNLLLIPLLGIVGAAMATCVSQALVVLLAYLKTMGLIKTIRFSWKRDLIIVMIAVSDIALVHVTDLLGQYWMRFSLNIIAVFVFPASLFLFGLMDIQFLKRAYSRIMSIGSLSILNNRNERYEKG
jgi:O-antigen/teichoic acid export membrane protein